MRQPPATTTVILAGGLGTRIGGAKALQLLQGQPLIDWVLQAVRVQCGTVLISANDNPASFSHCGCPVLPDQTTGYAGPLAGLQAAMLQASHEWVASVPCDAPFLPADLLARLHAAMGSPAEAAVAVTGGRRQPAIALYRRSVLPKLNDYLAGGGRKVKAWQDSLQLSEVPFEHAAAFINLNSVHELALANQILESGGSYDDIQRAIA
ncbi:MAG: molybdenum cofactor guanylyltransferase [Sideroxydans sp.]|nr:molybdenum cofactor guanylyltransferase [Sideroxydans sp.]